MDRGRWADACGDRTFRLYRRVPSSPEEHPAPHLRVTNVAAARDIGLAWLAGRTLSPLTDSFRQHVLHEASGFLLID
jgi:hypothetical protein